MADEQDFIRRWSRRKQAARIDPVVEEPPGETGQPATDASDAAAPSDSHDGSDSAETGQATVELPDIDSLTAESDFKAFMKDGVPKELRNRALCKLWRVNPAFGHLDGLNDYDGDFTDTATVVKGLKTLYKVGRGFIKDTDPEPVAGPEPETAGDGPVDDATPDGAAAGPVGDAEDDPESDPLTGGNKIT